MNLMRGLLTEKLDSWDLQTSAEAAHTCAQELRQLHSSSSTLPSKTLTNMNMSDNIRIMPL